MFKQTVMYLSHSVNDHCISSVDWSAQKRAIALSSVVVQEAWDNQQKYNSINTSSELSVDSALTTSDLVKCLLAPFCVTWTSFVVHYNYTLNNPSNTPECHCQSFPCVVYVYDVYARKDWQMQHVHVWFSILILKATQFDQRDLLTMPVDVVVEWILAMIHQYWTRVNDWNILTVNIYNILFKYQDVSRFNFANFSSTCSGFMPTTCSKCCTSAWSTGESARNQSSFGPCIIIRLFRLNEFQFTGTWFESPSLCLLDDAVEWFVILQFERWIGEYNVVTYCIAVFDHFHGALHLYL